jgi:hypothetical protein
MVFSILNVIFFLAFTVFAYFNLNDKDSWLWVSIYMIAAVLCLLNVFNVHYPILSLIMIFFYITYALVLFFSKNGVWDWLTKYKKESLVQSMQATKPYIEKTREFFGLLIISAALLMNYLIVN